MMHRVATHGYARALDVLVADADDLGYSDRNRSCGHTYDHK